MTEQIFAMIPDVGDWETGSRDYNLERLFRERNPSPANFYTCRVLILPVEQ